MGRLGFVFLLGLALPLGLVARERLPLNAGWSFTRGEAPGAARPDFDASGWRTLSLPHDWSIEEARSASEPAAGNGGYFPTGSGWYRKVFAAEPAWRGSRVAIEFEGVHMQAEVWLNGVNLAQQPYGYTPIRIDLTSHLRFDVPNVLAVRVDNSAQPNSRWYTGSGIYRPVWLHITSPVHVPEDGVFVCTQALDERKATLRISATIRNDTPRAQALRIETTILDPTGREAGRATTTQPADALAAIECAATLDLSAPQPWSPDSPALYRAVTRVFVQDQLCDEISTSFGLRTVRVSAERGFELNGRSLKLNGGNVHHDNGVLGAAAFPRAEERKVEMLKAAGFNAVRTAHNPPSRAFLEACDRIGLLVMDEIFDGWAAGKNKHDYSVLFAEWWRHDVDQWVKRDRNHPSVVIWSTGNEMFERGNAAGQQIARDLVARIRALDPTRPVSAGVNGLGTTGRWDQLDPLFAAFDIAGYNYELAHHASDHARLPQRIIVAAESYQSEVFANWAVAQEQAYMIGDFVWSALDYLGEAGIGRVYLSHETPLKHWEGPMWPWHGAYCGDIDLTGWRKPVSHYRNIVWDGGEKLYAAVLAPTPDGQPWNPTPWSLPPMRPSWTWPGHEGKMLTVEVYSRHEAVRLELNGQPIGEAHTGREQEFRAKFSVPFAPGELVAVGLAGDHVVEHFVLRTAGAPVSLRVAADRTTVAADGQDLSFVTIEAVDAAGTAVPDAAFPVTVEVKGQGTLAGLGTGDLTSLENYNSTTRTLHQGRALAVVRTSDQPGRIVVRVTAPGLPASELTLQSSSR